ncbi:MAG: nicotinate-nucleotide adenylyltransferase [Nitrospirae bacterium]|nr:nicotinate-nucleotide adenylyltransferase [Nitrospirota bacterium]
MRIGILGGTFNPIHNGHLKIAEAVFERLNLDKILFIPANLPPHKSEKGIIEARHRIEMVRLAIAGNPKFELSTIETERRGISYTIETLREMERIYGKGAELFFITGIDAFLEIETWKEADTLISDYNFVVIPRPSFYYKDLKKISMLNLPERELSALDKGAAELLELPMSGKGRLYLLNIPTVGISSKDIRNRIRSGEKFKYLLPESVELYIIKNRLYGY